MGPPTKNVTFAAGGPSKKRCYFIYFIFIKKEGKKKVFEDLFFRKIKKTRFVTCIKLGGCVSCILGGCVGMRGMIRRSCGPHLPGKSNNEEKSNRTLLFWKALRPQR